MVKINIDELEFKTELTALDYLNSRPKEEKEKLAEEIRLIAVSIIKPRLTYEEILSLELSEFNKLLQGYMSKIGKKLHDNVAQVQSKPPGAMTKGFNFIPISNMNPEKE